MLRKEDHRGSITTLSDDQLRQLITSANYRGLTATAAALRRERHRRLDPANDAGQHEESRHG
jgi:hypothetical protein